MCNGTNEPEGVQQNRLPQKQENINEINRAAAELQQNNADGKILFFLISKGERSQWNIVCRYEKSTHTHFHASIL